MQLKPHECINRICAANKREYPKKNTVEQLIYSIIDETVFRKTHTHSNLGTYQQFVVTK